MVKNKNNRGKKVKTMYLRVYLPKADVEYYDNEIKIEWGEEYDDTCEDRSKYGPFYIYFSFRQGKNPKFGSDPEFYTHQMTCMQFRYGSRNEDDACSKKHPQARPYVDLAIDSENCAMGTEYCDMTRTADPWRYFVKGDHSLKKLAFKVYLHTGSYDHNMIDSDTATITTTQLKPDINSIKYGYTKDKYKKYFRNKVPKSWRNELDRYYKQHSYS